jgi:acetyl esterase/lipase
LEYPWTQLTKRQKHNENNDRANPPPRAGRNFLATHIQSIHKTYLDELANAYVPASVDRRDPLVSPLFANLRGFSPVLIQVGSAETLLSDATRLAEAAGSADVDVTLEIWPQMIHAWPVWNAALEDGRRALARRESSFAPACTNL